MTKMNKEMKTEVKQLKSQIKSLKREVMDAKEGSSKQLESDDTVNTLKLTPQEIDELLAVRESVHSALEKSMKSTTACPDSETERSSTVEEGKNSLNLWLTNPTSPSATSDDAIQLSRTVILYVKVLTIHKDTASWEKGIISNCFQHYKGKSTATYFCQFVKNLAT